MVNIDLGSLNYVAVIVAGLVFWILGGIWYARPVFGARWMALVNVSEEEARKRAMMGLIVALIMSIVVAFFLAIVLQAMGAVTITDGIIGALLVWIGFMAIPAIGNLFFEKRPVSLYGINQSFALIGFILMGVILGVWV